MSKLKRAKQRYKYSGLFGLLNSILEFTYNRTIRRLSPTTRGLYNDVTVYDPKKLDSFVPWHQQDKPTYEYALVNGIKRHVHPGDTVVVVGAGLGVTSVIASQVVGDEGEVIAYEGSNKQIERIRWTLEQNKTEGQIELRHAIVGPDINLHGNKSGADYVSPESLPHCDVLELDCEGAEVEILKSIKIRPQTILVETHGIYDAPKEEIIDILTSIGYEIISQQVAENRRKTFCEYNDIYVVVAEWKDA